MTQQRQLVLGVVIIFLWVAIMLASFAHLAIANDDTERKTQFCYSYIKSLKTLWYDIHRNGIEQTMRDHPPADEGIDEQEALTLANEIASVEAADAQDWIEAKWKACMADPYSVRK